MKTLTSTKIWIALLVIAGLGGAAWWHREPVVAWYYVRQLTNAAIDDREVWAQKVADLDEAAVPRLLEGLANPSAEACANLQASLILLAKSWGPIDVRSHSLVERLRLSFDEFSTAGQERVLEMTSILLQEPGDRPLPPRLTKAAGELLQSAEKKPELHPATLLLAAALVDCVEPGQWVDAARGLAERGLKAESVPTRVAALHLLSREPMRKDKDILESTIGLLRDPSSVIRKAAVVLLADESDLVREESFLPLLHDDDAEVQHLVEMALRRRKLTDADIEIARMISARDAGTRMRVLQYLHRANDLNVGGLLRQLSHDPAPAVRAAAARAAGESRHVDLSERLREMAADDPHESVRQNASFYLQLRARRFPHD